MTLQYLDSLMQRDNLQKSQFFKGLPQVVAKMPKVNVTILNVYEANLDIHVHRNIFLKTVPLLHYAES